MTSIKILSKQLKNIGPAMAGKMLDAGIDTPEKLRQLGALKAYRKMYSSGDSYGDFNAAYLIALEAAIQDCAIADLPESIKTDFKQIAQELQAKKP